MTCTDSSNATLKTVYHNRKELYRNVAHYLSLLEIKAESGISVDTCKAYIGCGSNRSRRCIHNHCCFSVVRSERHLERPDWSCFHAIFNIYDPSHFKCQNQRFYLLHTWVLVDEPPAGTAAVRGVTAAPPKGAGFNAPPQ